MAFGGFQIWQMTSENMVVLMTAMILRMLTAACMPPNLRCLFRKYNWCIHKIGGTSHTKLKLLADLSSLLQQAQELASCVCLLSLSHSLREHYAWAQALPSVFSGPYWLQMYALTASNGVGLHCTMSCFTIYVCIYLYNVYYIYGQKSWQGIEFYNRWIFLKPPNH